MVRENLRALEVRIASGLFGVTWPENSLHRFGVSFQAQLMGYLVSCTAPCDAPINVCKTAPHS